LESTEVKNRLLKETALLAILGFFGLAVLPLCIYVVGETIFGAYGNGEFGSFFGALHRELREGEPAAWFLLLSPYVLWQLVRLTLWGFRQLGRRHTGSGEDAGEAPG
jgi:hypothetical protein